MEKATQRVKPKVKLKVRQRAKPMGFLMAKHSEMHSVIRSDSALPSQASPEMRA